MADLGEVFNPDDVPPSENNFEPIPAGIYRAEVIESEVNDTKSGNGRILALTFNVLDGPCANRKVFDRLNIRNANEQAQSIARRALADLFAATGTKPSGDSADLHFKPVLIRVTIDNKDQNYGPQNRIRAYKAVTETPRQPTQVNRATPSQASHAAPARAAAGGTRPWK